MSPTYGREEVQHSHHPHALDSDAAGRGVESDRNVAANAARVKPQQGRGDLRCCPVARDGLLRKGGYQPYSNSASLQDWTRIARPLKNHSLVEQVTGHG